MDNHIRRIFRSMPGLSLVMKPDSDFTIVAASDSCLHAAQRDAGIEVAAAIRGAESTATSTAAVTLIALTGWGQADDLERARLAGFNHHLVKPANIERLRQLLLPLPRG